MREFYEFKKNAKNYLKTRQKCSKNSNLKVLCDNIRNKIHDFIRLHDEINVVEDQTHDNLTIIPKNDMSGIQPPTTTFHEGPSPSTSIKQEKIVEVKIEPQELDQVEEQDTASFLLFCRSFGESASSFQSDESTGSSADASGVNRSRLPAFEQDTYFDGNRFVLKTEVPPKKILKENRKRQRKPEQWEVNVQKQLKNAGKRYRSTKGYVVAEKSMGSPCNCRKLCSTKINEKNRLTNFNSYWELDNVLKKRTFILDHIEVGKPMKAKNKPKNRGVTKLIHHFLNISNSDGSEERIRVCKRMFLSTLGISNTVITTTLKLHSQY